jgi:hypothetical protein
VVTLVVARGMCRSAASDRDFGRQGIDAVFNVKTTMKTRSEQNADWQPNILAAEYQWMRFE